MKQDDYQFFIEDLKREKTPFKVVFSGSVKKVFCEYGRRESGKIEPFKFTGQRFKPNELGLINSVKWYVRKRFKPQKDFSDKIPFIDYGNFTEATDAYEIDINKAYWSAAYKRGFISEEIYIKGLQTKDKRARLAALGVNAKADYTFNFDGEKTTFEGKTTTGYNYIFFEIAKEIATLMTDLRALLDEDYLFYWVDAVFFRKKKTLLW